MLMRKGVRVFKAAVPAIGVLLTFSACVIGAEPEVEVKSGSSGQALIERQSFEGTWPFTVEEGALSCEGDAVRFTPTDGRTYAVNGTAKGIMGDSADIEPIWADAKGPAPKKWIGDVIDYGLSLC